MSACSAPFMLPTKQPPPANNKKCHRLDSPTAIRPSHLLVCVTPTLHRQWLRQSELYSIFFFLFVHHEHRLEEESEWWVLRHSPILRSRRWPGRCQRKKGLIKPLMPSDGRKRRRLLTSRLVCRASGRTDHRSNSDARRGGVRSARCCFIVLCSLPYPQGKVKPQLFLDSPRWCLCPAFFLSLV